MSVKIRLAVTGKTNQISYRIVASDTHSKRDGKFLEILGFYNPTSNAVEKLRIDQDKIDAWVKKGALLTPAVALLIEKGTLERPKKPKVKPVEEFQTIPAQAPQEPKADEPQAEAPAQEAKPEPGTETPAVEKVKVEEEEAKVEESTPQETPSEETKPDQEEKAEDAK